MARTSPLLLPRLRRLLEQVGGNLKLARRRRKQSAAVVAERAGISRKTLYRVEQGDPAVALGLYARVLQALRLEQDLALLGADDALGRKLQDAALLPESRAVPKPASSISRAGKRDAKVGESEGESG
jgi:transcriptional regulator with XRE-family HTH domain